MCDKGHTRSEIGNKCVMSHTRSEMGDKGYTRSEMGDECVIRVIPVRKGVIKCVMRALKQLIY